jgi:hypothetical protein
MGYYVDRKETPSDSSYLFSAGKALEVEPEDVEYLLSLQRPGGVCCGASSPEPFKYFVKE